MKLLVYLPDLRTEWLPEVAARFRELVMDVEFDPAFALESGVMPVRLGDQYAEIDFEQRAFKYAAPLSVNPEINQKLKACTKVVTLKINATHTIAMRVGLYFAALLAERSDGVVYVPRRDDYVTAEEALQQFAPEIQKYERELPPEDWRLVDFTGWPK